MIRLTTSTALSVASTLGTLLAILAIGPAAMAQDTAKFTTTTITTAPKKPVTLTVDATAPAGVEYIAIVSGPYVYQKEYVPPAGTRPTSVTWSYTFAGFTRPGTYVFYCTVGDFSYGGTWGSNYCTVIVTN